MRAVLLREFGGPLGLEEIRDTPVPGPGQVLVRVAASGVNPLDTKIRAGKAAHARSRLAGRTRSGPRRGRRGGRPGRHRLRPG